MSKRGPYKSYLCQTNNLKVPRKTKYYQRKLNILYNNDEDDSTAEFLMDSADLDVGGVDVNED